MLVVVELHIAQLQAALALEVHLFGAVDHDLGHARVVQQRLDRAEADDVGGQLLEQALLLGAREDQVLGLDDLVEQALEAVAYLVDLVAVDRRVELGDQLALDAVLQAALGLGDLGLDRVGAKRRLGSDWCAGEWARVAGRRGGGRDRPCAAMFKAFEQRHRTLS